MITPKRLQTVVAVLLIAFAVAIAWRVLRPQEKEPIYQGKGLHVWLADYYYAWARGDARAQEAAAVGIRNIGTNGVPIMVRMMRKEDSSLVASLNPWWERHVMNAPHLPVWIRVPFWYRTKALVVNMQAMQGFEVLGANAQNAVPELIAVYDLSSSADNQFCVSEALIAIGPQAAQAAIPSFLRAATNSDTHTRQNAVFALAKSHVEPALVVPALTKALSDTNANTRSAAVLGLREIGWSGGARQAVPALVQLLSDPDMQVRRGASNALQNLDYDAAAKAGVRE